LFDPDLDAPTILLVQQLSIHHAIEQDLGVCETVVTVALHTVDDCPLPINPVIAIRNVPTDVCEQF
jgi:hypothetical protein